MERHPPIRYQREYRDEKGIWHPSLRRVENIWELIGINSVTSVVVRNQAFKHLGKFLSDDLLSAIASRVDDDALCDNIFFRILHELTASLYYLDNIAEQKKWCSFLNRGFLFPILKKKGTKKNILVASKVAETGKLYLAALVRWFFYQSPEERRKWLGQVGEKLSDDVFVTSVPKDISKLITLRGACYQVKETVHRRTYDCSNNVTQAQLDSFTAMFGIFGGGFGNWHQRNLADRLNSIPFVSLDEYLF